MINLKENRFLKRIICLQTINPPSPHTGSTKERGFILQNRHIHASKLLQQPKTDAKNRIGSTPYKALTTNGKNESRAERIHFEKREKSERQINFRISA